VPLNSWVFFSVERHLVSCPCTAALPARETAHRQPCSSLWSCYAGGSWSCAAGGAVVGLRAGGLELRLLPSLEGSALPQEAEGKRVSWEQDCPTLHFFLSGIPVTAWEERPGSADSPAGSLGPSLGRGGCCRPARCPAPVAAGGVPRAQIHSPGLWPVGQPPHQPVPVPGARPCARTPPSTSSQFL